MSAVDSEEELKICYIFWLIINKPRPNLRSGDTSIQGTLALVPI